MIKGKLRRVLNTLRTQYDGGRKEFQQVKVFGLQFYGKVQPYPSYFSAIYDSYLYFYIGHTVYVYSLCRPYDGLYLFQVEATFEIPSCAGFISQEASKVYVQCGKNEGKRMISSSRSCRLLRNSHVSPALEHTTCTSRFHIQLCEQ